MNYQLKALFLFLSFSLLNVSLKAIAHETNIQYRQTQAIEIKVTYDDETPLENAQVIVYSPDDPATPWLTGTTDAQGNFTFTPDPSQSGNWDVKVRQSGHGDTISIPWNSDAIATEIQDSSSSNSVYTPLQKAVMAVVGIWGFVGTALFFSRRKVK